MILADSSIWIDQLQQGDPVLDRLLSKDQILCHPIVAAEIALGSLKDRALIVETLDGLPQSPDVELEEVRELIENEQAFSKGIGAADAILLASSRLQAEGRLWTRDKRLNALAEQFGIAYQPSH